MTSLSCRTLAVTIAALALALPAYAANELCGQTVTQNLTFTADQSCTGTGLIVGADGITIDLGGFTLAGDQTSGHNGIELNGHNGTTIKNGTIRHFDEGINYFSVCIDDITISNLVVRDNATGGLGIASVSSWTIDHSAFIDNGSDGTDVVMFCGSGTGTVTSSAFVGNGGLGLSVASGDDVTIAVTKTLATHNAGVGVQVDGGRRTTTTVASNTVAENGATGILLDYEFSGDDTTKVAKNVVVRNHDGIKLFHVPAATLTANLIAGNRVSGIDVENHADGATATKNRVIGNGGDGISIDATTDVAVIKGNTLVGNQDNGILTASATATLAKNVANANGGQGILAAGGAVDGGGNTARANASIPQCSPAVACPPAFVAKAGPVTPTCGMHVATSIKLGADTAVCANIPGLIVDADGVTIDLNGHTVKGDSMPGNIGIDVGGHSRVTVKNGVVRGFDKGIYAATAANVKLVNVEARDNLGDGATLSGSAGFAVTKSVFVANGGAGLTLGDGTHDAKVNGTFAVANGGDGVAVRAANTLLTKITSTANAGNGIGVSAAATTATIQATTSAANQQDGIRADADTVTVAKTTLAGNALDGVEARSSGTGVKLTGNVADGNGGDGLGIHQLAHANAMTKNTTIGNAGNGLTVDTPVGPTTVAGNTTIGNADGIVANPSTTVAKNVATANLDLGIDAPSGAIDGGGNKARDNAGAAQCSPSIVCN